MVERHWDDPELRAVRERRAASLRPEPAPVPARVPYVAPAPPSRPQKLWETMVVAGQTVLLGIAWLFLFLIVHLFWLPFLWFAIVGAAFEEIRDSRKLERERKSREARIASSQAGLGGS